MNPLTDQQRVDLHAYGGAPVPVVDEQTQQVYYIISSVQFERLRALLVTDEFDAREMYPLIAKTAADAGWSDPIMDEYDHYDEHRPQN